MIVHLRKKYSFSESLKRFFAKVIAKCLHLLTDNHLKDKRPPLAVFAYDHISHYVNIDGYYERDELELFFTWISKNHSHIFNGMAVDIGANIGNHSIIFSSFFRHVYSFEPNPRTFQILNLNSELVGNMTCYPFGISDNESSAILTLNPSNIGAARLSVNPDKNSIQINLKTLDGQTNILKSKITLMKIDVEGHEYQAICGSTKVIEQNRPFILFEQQKSDFVNGSSLVIQKLKSLGYNQFLTITKFPSLAFRSRSIFHKVVCHLYDLIFGERLSLVEQKEFPTGFYSFIVAVPNSEETKF